jgi:hypothetical protein
MIPLLLIAAEVATAKPKMGPIEKEHKMVVEAVRGCAESEDDVIVVCSRDRGIAEAYRLPKLDPRFASNLRPNGRGGLGGADIGAAGAGSCSNTGAGGFTGCSKRDYDAWGQWKLEKKKETQAFEDPN